MTVAAFKDLCLDAADPSALGPFWARVLDREWHLEPDGDGRVAGATPAHAIWVNRVPEPKAVKNRVHLDIYTAAIADLEALGSTLVSAEADDRRWTVMTDPEGGEYCAFLRERVPAERLHGLVVDSADPQAIAMWWQTVLGGELTVHERGWATIEAIPGFPIQTFDFVAVPEPKAAKNRVHWDVTGPKSDLIACGASLLRPRDGEIGWDVLADPEGNEFCAFCPA